MTQPEYPHTRKVQDRMERDAKRSREKLLAAGSTMPRVCGFVHKPLKSSKDPAPIVCYRVAGAGTTHHGRGFCDYHTVQAEAELSDTKAPAQLQAAKRTAYEQAQFFGQRTDVDPITIILEEIGRTASVVEWLNQKFVEERAMGMTDRQIMQQQTLKDGYKISVWMELYQAERKHLIGTCLAAVKAGLSERKVRIAEQQGRMIISIMLAIVHDPELGLTPDQQYRSLPVIRKHLTTTITQEGTPVDPKKILEAQAVEV